MKTYTKLFAILLIILSHQSIFSQRILYVNNFNDILGEPAKEKKLLSFAQKSKFTSLILYDLHKINKRMELSDVNKNHILANFIYNARTNYNIIDIAGSAENGGFFIKSIDAYNKSRTLINEKFNVYNLEYEYWDEDSSGPGGYYCENYLRKNGIPCNREGSFKYYLETISIMQLLSDESEQPIKVEAYLAKSKQNEILKIAKLVDRILICAYCTTPAKSYKKVQKFIKFLSKSQSFPEVSIILSSELGFMGGYLKYNSLDVAESEFKKKMNSEKLKTAINLVDFTYYNYSELEKSVNHQNFRSTGVKN